MIVENPIFISAVLIGPIFIIVGMILSKFPPKKINSLYGYRTKKSMKNETNWNVSQKYAGRMMIILGFFYSLFLLILTIFEINENVGLVLSLGLMFIMCFGIFYLTEKKLKKLSNKTLLLT